MLEEIVAVVPVIGLEIVQTLLMIIGLPLQVGAVDVLLIFAAKGEQPLIGKILN